MSVQKFVTYNSLDTNGQVLDNTYDLKLEIVEKYGNYLIHKDIVRHQSLKKQNTVSTKTRSEVRGGGRKPWQQKGTGRARAGSNRSPLWKGGGVIFGPKPKVEKIKINRKERKLALKTLLYNKRNFVLVINNLENVIDSPNTKTFLKICQNCTIDLNQKVLLVVSKKTKSIKLSTRNLKNVELVSAESLNTLSLLKAKQIILTSSSLATIKEMYCE